MIRQAYYAGSWYPANKSDLEKELEDLFTNSEFGPGMLPKTQDQKIRTIIGGVTPHAGYYYSGNCAAFTFFNIFKEKVPDTIILLGTDHVGYNKIGLMEEGEWETPLGNLQIDEALARKIIDISDEIISDDSAFSVREHNIEIQLPFIKYCAKNQEVNIVPIKYGILKFKQFQSYTTLDKAAEDIAKAIESLNKDIVIIASTDMSHEPVRTEKGLESMKKMDRAVIEEFLKINPENTFKAALNTSVCGPQTLTSLVLICKKLNASKANLITYFTSYDRRGTFGPHTVGYFSGVLIKE
ncbi:MAG: AmmeMemoRadiSam system protein B [Promethearchaeota archaeon]